MFSKLSIFTTSIRIQFATAFCFPWKEVALTMLASEKQDLENPNLSDNFSPSYTWI